jgi:hypothetical protein
MRSANSSRARARAGSVFSRARDSATRLRPRALSRWINAVSPCRSAGLTEANSRSSSSTATRTSAKRSSLGGLSCSLSRATLTCSRAANICVLLRAGPCIRAKSARNCWSASATFGSLASHFACSICTWLRRLTNSARIASQPGPVRVLRSRAASWKSRAAAIAFSQAVSCSALLNPAGSRFSSASHSRLTISS